MGTPRASKDGPPTTSRSLLLLTAATVVCLVPFASKAFTVDEPLFLWAAKWILHHPFDPYGFNVNWYGFTDSMANVTRNPPLACYYLAAAGLSVGWGETALRTVFLIPAIGAITGTYFLAQRMCSRPLLACLATLFTPVFLISSSSVMCDTMTLALSVWAVVLWMRGLEKNSTAELAGSALLIALAALAKYSAAGLIPILFLYSLEKKRRLGWWTACFLIPTAILACYQIVTAKLYGRGLLLDAGAYSAAVRGILAVGLPVKGLMGLVFTGGCFATAMFFAPLLWSRRALIGWIGLTVAAIVAFSLPLSINSYPLRYAEGGVRWPIVVQLGVFCVGGVSLLALSLQDLLRKKDADSALLLMWVAGTFIFAAFVNWTVNGRSILQLVPAASILVARRIDERAAGNSGPARARFNAAALALVPAAALSLLVTWADGVWSNTDRDAAIEICRNYNEARKPVWFQGHWGFQYYMESEGARAVDVMRSRLSRSDIMVFPSDNVNLLPVSQRDFAVEETISKQPTTWLATMNASVGAAMHASTRGILPFAFGRVPPMNYYILSARRAVRFQAK